MVVADNTAVLGGETTCLLDLPSAGSRPSSSIFSRPAFEGLGRDNYTQIEDRRRGKGSEDPPPAWPSDGLQSYRAQPPSTLPNQYQQSSAAAAAAAPSPDRRKTRYPSLAPAPGSFRVAGGMGRGGGGSRGGQGGGGDTRASEAVAHARKTWAPPALRTQAVASYGAVPDLEVIPEDTEVKRFHIRERVRRYTDFGCPSCVVS